MNGNIPRLYFLFIARSRGKHSSPKVVGFAGGNKRFQMEWGCDIETICHRRRFSLHNKVMDFGGDFVLADVIWELPGISKLNET